jgi:hypothetical protein
MHTYGNVASSTVSSGSHYRNTAGDRDITNSESVVSASPSGTSSEDRYSSSDSSASPTAQKKGKSSGTKRPPARNKSANRAKQCKTILREIDAGNIVEKFGKEKLIREMGKLLNNRRATVLESRNLINMHCKNSIRAKLTLGANDDAATEVVECYDKAVIIHVFLTLCCCSHIS